MVPDGILWLFKVIGQFSWLFMVLGQLLWFFKVPDLFFMVVYDSKLVYIQAKRRRREVRR